MAVIFASGWEASGGVDPTDGGIWTTGGAAPSVTGAIVHSGQWALLTDFPGGNSGVYMNPMAGDYATFFQRWYYRIVGGTGGFANGDSTNVCQWFGTGFDFQVVVGFETDGVGTRWFLTSPTAGKRYSAYGLVTVNEWHYMEMQRVVGLGNGITTLWVDSPVPLIQNLAETIGSNVKWVWGLGIQSGINFSQAVVDDVIADDANYIGPMVTAIPLKMVGVGL